MTNTMAIHTRELIEAVSIVTENHNVRVTVKSSLKASFIVAGTTFVGAILMGPIGIIAGSITGGLASYNMTKGTFKSAAVVLRDELSEEQKDQLCMHIYEAFKDFGAQDLAMLIPLLTTNASVQKMIINQVIAFLTREMQMQIID